MRHPFFLPFLLSLGILLGPAFSQSLHEVPLTPEQAATLDVFSAKAAGEPVKASKKARQFFRRLSKATRSRKDLIGTDYLSADAIFKLIEEQGAFEQVEPAVVEVVRDLFPKTLEPVGKNLKMMAYDRAKILKIETIDHQREIYYVRHYDNELNVTTQIRWWLIEEEGRLLVYDFEDLSSNLRLSRLMAIGITSSTGGETPSWLKLLARLVAIMNERDLTDPETWVAIEKPLLKMAQLELPRDIQVFASVMVVALHQMNGDSEKGLAELMRAREEELAGPLWHYQRASILMDLESYTEALEEFATHAKNLGWDSDVLEMVSDCYFELRLPEKAREAAQRGLADNPRSWACAASLAAASTEEQLLAEFPAIYRGGGKNEEFYEIALDYLIDLDQIEKAKSFYTSYREQVKESELFDYYDELFDDLEAE